MKRTLALSIIILAVEFISYGQAYACESAEFTDITPEQTPYVTEVAALGFMTGIEPEVFAPESILTRAQVITILWRMDGCPDADSEVFVRKGFRDVDETAWYAHPMAWACEHGITVGSEWLLCPDEPMTREQLAAILYRHSEESYRVFGRTQIPTNVSPWARIAYEWAAASDLGFWPESEPQGFVTRAEMAHVAIDYWFFLNNREEVLNWQ